MKISAEWLAEFVAGFEQQIEGEDGAAVGRQLWIDMDDDWRNARAAMPVLGHEGALAEAEAWNTN